MWNNPIAPWVSGGLLWEEQGDLKSPHKKLRISILVTFTWFLHTWEVFLFLPLLSPASTLIVSTPLSNYGQKAKLDNPSFNYHLMQFLCFFRWKIVEDVFPGNLLVEFTASLHTLSDGYGRLFTITIKSLVLVLIASFRNEVLYFRLMNSCPLCWKFKKAPPSRAWKVWYISWNRRISSGIQDSWAQLYDEQYRQSRLCSKRLSNIYFYMLLTESIDYECRF